MEVELKNSDYEYKVRPGRYTLMLSVIFILFLLLGAKLGPNIFILFILIIITIIPILILFRNSLVNYLPKGLSDNLQEIDKKNAKNKTRSISKLAKEIGYYITVTIILIGVSILIFHINKNMKNNQLDLPKKFKDEHKFIVALFLVLLSSSIVMEM